MELRKKEELFMSKINKFLQAKSEQEGSYGFYMIVIAYVLSFVMLLIGSDSFYSIRSSAAKSRYANEEISIEEVNPSLQLTKVVHKPKEAYHDIINPYNLPEEDKIEKTIEKQAVSLVSEYTHWLMGYGMNISEYEQAIEALSKNLSEKKEDKVKSAEKKIENEDTSNSKSSKYVIKLSSDEIGMLERIVEAEAGGEGLKGKVLVANVVINRVKDKNFPNSVEGVIYQEDHGEYQFSPMKDKRFWKVTVSKETKKAVKMALNGEDYSEGALYFIARSMASRKNIQWFDDSLEWLFKYGSHEFYKNK